MPTRFCPKLQRDRDRLAFALHRPVGYPEERHMATIIRGRLQGLAAVAFLMTASALLIQPAVAQQKTLKFVPEADLRSLDPIWTTAYITRNYGYMVYDTLFAVNEKVAPQPPMVG